MEEKRKISPYHDLEASTFVLIETLRNTQDKGTRNDVYIWYVIKLLAAFARKRITEMQLDALWVAVDKITH